MPYWAWKHVTERLDMMIRRAERAFADPGLAFRFRIIPKAIKPSPIVIADHLPGLLLGPDGKPLKEVS